jgi:hypothetical protein
VREVLLLPEHVLGEGAAALTEDLVAGLELRHVLADSLDVPGHVDAADRVFWPAPPFAHADQVGEASHHSPVEGVNRRRPDPHEHVVVLDHRLVDLAELELVGGAVLLLDDCPHRRRLGRQIRHER